MTLKPVPWANWRDDRRGHRPSRRRELPGRTADRGIGVESSPRYARCRWADLRVPIVGCGHGFRSQVAALVAAQRAPADFAFSVLTAPPVGPAGPTPPADLTRSRTEATRLLSALPVLLDGAELDTYQVWESRRLWRRLLQDLARGVSHSWLIRAKAIDSAALNAVRASTAGASGAIPRNRQPGRPPDAAHVQQPTAVARPDRRQL
jgi:hypothetical protein